ncbi:MAG: CinA family protein [Sediminimonas qiaohouensis]|uniref:CinA family protein n=1 Tax=Sediminimonas qiaohouensis TaxID=552061 RepID=A0A7C9LRB0_9RHOB|nr:CinA family protein [Sediminimonas qiaohouensis]MTJ04096.1 CinA family protein [Sediminimonas qiaohouensis]
MTRTDEILSLYRQKKWMIATAESCTAGMVAVAITDVAGSSDVFERGFVTYTNNAKIEMLGVQADTLAKDGAVSEAVVEQMARGALAASEAHVAVSISGIAGPGGSEFKPEGRVCFGLATPSGCESETIEFGALGRAGVREAARDHALDLLIKAARRV